MGRVDPILAFSDGILDKILLSIIQIVLFLWASLGSTWGLVIFRLFLFSTRPTVCPGNICSYQQYLSFYWLIFGEHLEQIPDVTVTFVLATFFLIRNISCYWPDFDQIFSNKLFGGPNFCWPNIFSSKYYLDQINFWTTNSFKPYFFFGPTIHDSKFRFWPNT